MKAKDDERTIDMPVSPLVSKIVSIDPQAHFGVLAEDLHETLTKLETGGFAVDSLQAPIFYEAPTDYLSCDSNIGTLMGEVRRNVMRELRSDSVSHHDRKVISDAISMSVMKANSYDEALSNLFLWSEQVDE